MYDAIPYQYWFLALYRIDFHFESEIILLNDLYVPVNNDTLPTQVSDKKCGMEN